MLAEGIASLVGTWKEDIHGVTGGEVGGALGGGTGSQALSPQPFLPGSQELPPLLSSRKTPREG